MTPLSRLVTETMRRRGWSTQQVESRGIAHSTLHRYMQPVPLKVPPRRPQLENLARVLDLPVSTVERAAIETVGYVYDVPGGTDVRVLIGSLTELSHAEQVKAAEQLKQWADEILRSDP